MSEQNLDIGIKVTATGDGAKRAAEGLKEVAAAQDRLVKDGYPATWEAAKKDEEVTKKAVSAKQQYKESLKGLALEFPVLARVMGFMQAPITLVAAALGTAIAMVKQYADSVHEAGRASQSFESIKSKMEEMQAAAKETAKVFSDEFAAIAKSAASATTTLNNMTLALQMQQMASEKLADAELANELEKIQSAVAAGKMTPAQAVVATAAAQQGARERTAAREIAGLRGEEGLLRQAEGAEGARAKEAAARAAGLLGPETAAKDAAAKAALESAAVTEGNKAQRAIISDQLETARGLMEASKRTVGGAAYAALHPGRVAGLAREFGSMPAEQIEAALLDRLNNLDLSESSASRFATDRAAKANEIKRQREAAEAESKAAEANRLRFQQEAGRAGFRASRLEMIQSQVSPIEAETGAMRTQREVNDIKAREDADLRKRAKEWQKNASPGDAMPPEFQRFIRNGQFDPTASVESAGGSVVEAVAQVNVAVNEQFAAIREELERMRAEIAHGQGNNKAGLLG